MNELIEKIITDTQGKFCRWEYTSEVWDARGPGYSLHQVSSIFRRRFRMFTTAGITDIWINDPQWARIQAVILPKQLTPAQMLKAIT